MRDASDARYGRDLKIHPPTLNHSGMTWGIHPDKDGVAAGYTQIKGIGDAFAEAIISDRDENGEFGDWSELIRVKGIGPAKMAMIQEFCSKEDPFDLMKLRDGSKGIVDAIKAGELGPMPIPDTLADNIPYEAKRSNHVVMGVVKNRNLQDLYENHRSRTGEELLRKDVQDPDLKDSMTLYMEDESGLMTVKVSRWDYPKMKEALWGLKLNHDFLLMRVQKKPYYGKTVHCKSLWVIDPD
jgi:hypothetical protein